MGFRIIEAEQRSPEWYEARLGRLTGSCAGDMLATIKAGEAAARRDLRMRLVCERLTGCSQDDGYVNAVMQRGIDKEVNALAAYMARTGRIVEATGFLAHDTHMAGCSLDGHVGAFEGIVEAKAPKSATHLRYLRSGACPPDYLPQITHNLWITDARWCDFVSFDDRFPPELQLVIVRVMRDEGVIAAYESKALGFLAEVEHEENVIRTLANPARQLEAVL